MFYGSLYLTALPGLLERRLGIKGWLLVPEKEN